ncbi:hypothetical protein AKJ09_07452 [Labilithrix luteola]|uniref:Uncharacterized protein n=1 Tax=Labilithrix luteola TaxID=1391654 RepID=A0A0K1Q4Z9_9BACT|nr:hypothetical protein AKJ09_07452 [Labilithrix luteola]
MTPPASATDAVQPSPVWGAPPYRPMPEWARPAAPKPAPKPAPFKAKELIAALALVLTSDLVMYAHDGFALGGLGLTAFLVIVPIVLFVVARNVRRSVRLGVISALLVATGLRASYAPTAGTAVVGLGLVFAFALTLRSLRTFVPEVVAAAFSGMGALGTRVAAAAAGVKRVAARTPVGRVSILPVVIPAGLCAIFLGVFALANPVVAHGISAAWTAFGHWVALPSPGRIVVWCLALLGAVTLLRPSFRSSRAAEVSAPIMEGASTTNLLVARNAFVALNVLFLAYNLLDAAYLWTGAPPAGMRTQQYAHQGAFWLTLALVMLTAVVGVTFRGPLAQDPKAALARHVAYVWMGQGLVLALGTYRRIAIHVAYSGLSDLRIVGILGTTLVVFGVVLVAAKLHRGRTFAWLLRRQLDALAVTLAIYTIFPTHLVSAKVNVGRIESGEYRPMLHMFRQSHEGESAAAVIPLLHHSDERVRQGVAALLETELTRLGTEIQEQTTWRQKSWGSRRTLEALEAARGEIAKVLGTVDRDAARSVLLEISHVANDGSSLEEILAIPNATNWQERSGSRSMY